MSVRDMDMGNNFHVNKHHAMRKIKALFLFMLFATVSVAQTNTQQEYSDSLAILKIVDEYCQTINTCDTALTAKIWSHDPGVSFIGPMGRYSTYKEIIRDFIIGVWENNFTTRNLQGEDVKLHIVGDMAWLEFSWKFDAITKDGKPHNTKGLETQILQREPDGWKFVHIHYSAKK